MFAAYFTVSAAALMIYDYFITFEREVEFIWPSKWTFIKTLFFVTRYSPFLDVTLDVFLVADHRLEPRRWLVVYLVSRWMFFIGIVWAEVVLFVRTLVLWDKRRSITTTLVVGFCGAVLCALVVIIIWTKSLIDIQVDTSQLRSPVDIVVGGNPIVGLSFAAIIIFETVVIVLTIVRMIQQLNLSGRSILRFSVFRVLYRDGIMFFIYLVGISTANFLVILINKPGGKEFLVVLQRVLHSALISRIILNLREAQYQGRPTETPNAPALEYELESRESKSRDSKSVPNSVP